MLVDHALEIAPCDAVLVPTLDGSTARAVARWKAPVWIVAAGPEPGAMQGLAFSYGVHTVDLGEEPHDWRDYTWRLLSELGLPCRQVLLVAGPSPRIRRPINAWNLWSLTRGLKPPQDRLLGFDRQEDGEANGNRRQPVTGRDRS
jgi:hypothetical protein